jgi:hypothetical protein
MDEEIDEIFAFLSKKITPEQRPDFWAKIKFSSVAEIKSLSDEKKEQALELLRIEKRKRTTAGDIKFSLDQLYETKKEASKSTSIYVPKSTRIEKTLID